MKRCNTITITFVLVLLTIPYLLAGHSRLSTDTKAQQRVKHEPVKKRRIYFVLGIGIHWKNDSGYLTVYNKGVLNNTAELGYWFNRHLAVGVKFSYLSQQGKTPTFQEETSLRQSACSISLKAGTGNWLKGYLSLGLGCLFFKEDSYIAVVRSSRLGWESELGVEIPLALRFYVLSALRYQSYIKEFAGLGEKQQLGGLEARVGIGIRF